MIWGSEEADIEPNPNIMCILYIYICARVVYVVFLFVARYFCVALPASGRALLPASRPRMQRSYLQILIKSCSQLMSIVALSTYLNLLIPCADFLDCLKLSPVPLQGDPVGAAKGSKA